MSGPTERDCGPGDTRTIDALTELDLHLKRRAERVAEGARSNPDRAEVMWRLCHDLIERARGVRMAIELAKGGKLLCGILAPASTLAECAELVASRTENVECQTCRGGREWWTAVQANPCPDCGGAGFQASGICDYCGSGGINPDSVIENCPKCSTPENVEELK